MILKFGDIRVKLTELVNTVSLRFRETSVLVRYPVENISRIVMNRIQNEYHNIDVPFKKDNREQYSVGITNDTQVVTPTHSSISSELQGQSSRHTDNPDTTIISNISRQFVTNSTHHNQIPPLQKNEDIRGRRGRYRIQSNGAIQEFERVRLYSATHVLNNKPVVIKEYLLPDTDFNPKEARERKEQFELVTSINLKSGGGQDFRLVTAWDAIAPLNEKRCYFITEPIANSITLRQYLEKVQRPMTSMQVREVIGQVLQTLWFLHNQRIRLPNGEVCFGLPHGNLSLDSLLIVATDQQSIITNQQFFIYLSDLSLWEDLFKSPTSKVISPSIDKDLKDLGYLSFFLLQGATEDLIYGQPFDPKNEQNWSSIEEDITLKRIIHRLIGLDAPFLNADDARHALLTSPTELQTSKPLSTEIDNYQSKKLHNSNNLRLFMILVGLLFGFGGIFLWQVVNSISKGKIPELMNLSNNNSYTCCIAKLKNVPSGIFNYSTSSSEGTWNYLMTTPGLVSVGKKINQELDARGMQLQLRYKPEPFIDLAIQKVKAKKVDFLITNIVADIDKHLEKANFKLQPIAYEGIVIFVAFSDAKREGSFPEALKGKISFEQLRKLYSGEINNWKQLNYNLPNLPVKLYIPVEEEAIKEFREIVFDNYPQQKQKFNQLIKEGKIIKKETLKTLGDVLGDFETEDPSKRSGDIGFGLLRKIYGQCSVYPLSVGEKGQEVQALVQTDGSDINPKIDLCNDKGSYQPNIEAFNSKRYPFAYSMAVAYPNDETRSQAGKSFAEIMLTDEAQFLLNEVGLVPVRKLNNN